MSASTVDQYIGLVHKGSESSVSVRIVYVNGVFAVKCMNLVAGYICTVNKQLFNLYCSL